MPIRILTETINTPIDNLNKETRLNVTAPDDYIIVLDNSRAIQDLCTSVLEFTPDADTIAYTCNFNNGDATSFNYDSDFVTFDGEMELKDIYTYDMTSQGTLGGGTLYESDIIPVAYFNDINSIVASTPTLTINAVPLAQVIEASGNIDLTGVERLVSIALTKTTSGNGIVKIAASFDNGTTYKSYVDNEWVAVDITDLLDFASKGMTETTLEALTEMELEIARGESITIRFAYYLDRPAYGDNASTDMINLTVHMLGRDDVCDNSKYTLSYVESTKTITYSFTENGTYTMTWID